MTDLTNEAQSISRQAQGAAKRYESNVASLYREDGERIYSDAQHDALEESYRRERDDTFADLAQRAESLEQRAAAAREAVAGADLIVWQLGECGREGAGVALRPGPDGLTPRFLC